MTSIGSAEFPEMPFSEALKTIEGIKREKAQTTAALGKVMGLTSTTTGYFYQKLSSLSKFYGLVDRDKANLTLTDLAKRIVYSLSEADRQAAIRESIFRVTLFQRLFQALGPDYHELDFPTKLLEVTKASHEEIADKSEKVEALYRDAVQYLRGGEVVTPTPGSPTEPTAARSHIGGGSSGSTSPEPRALPPIVAGTAEDYWTFHTGDSFVRLKKKDPKLLHTAKRVIDAWLFAEGEEPENKAT